MRCFSLVCLSLCLFAPQTWADTFDAYTLPVLEKAKEDGLLKAVPQLTTDQLEAKTKTLPGTSSAMVAVYTNDRRWAKILIQPARLKVKEEQLPMFLVEKYATFQEGTERQIRASGQNTHLYEGTRLQLDRGQVVPEKLGGDLIAEKSSSGGLLLKPLGEAKLFILEKAVPGLSKKKAPKLQVGETFEIRYFEGTYKLLDDGRRTGLLKLQVQANGDVSGTYTSDKDGREYEVRGKIGQPKHAIRFEIVYPAFKQAFDGHLFTGNARMIAGTTSIQERPAAFVAERVEE